MWEEVLRVLSVIGTLLLVLAVFAGAYYVSKIMAKRYQGFQSAVKGGIELIDRRNLGKDQALLVVRVAEKTFLLGVTPHHITKLEELDETFFPAVVPPTDGPPNFLDTWKEALKKVKKAGDGSDETNEKR